MQHILIIGYVWVEKTTGAGNRMMQLIELFQQQNWKVTFASAAQKTENSLNLKEQGIDEVLIKLNSSSFDDFIKKLQPNFVLFDRFMIEEQFGWRVTENCPNTIKILDTEDLHFLRKTRQKQLKKEEEFTNEALLNSDEAKREIASILRCDLSLIISSYEIKLLQEVFKIDKNILHHLPFLLDKIDEKTEISWLPFNERENFVFIGNFFHAPNVDAVLQLKSIWEHIRKQLPKAELHVYGAYVTQQIQQLHKSQDGFLVKGFTKNALGVVKDARVVLAPIRFGAGIKGKLTEAMICGTPSMTTLIGAEGMRNNLPWNGYIEDNFKKFANKAVELYSNKNMWIEAQQNGIRIINQLYDKGELSEPFINRLKELQENLETHRTLNFFGSLIHHQTLQATKYMSKWIEEKNKN